MALGRILKGWGKFVKHSLLIVNCVIFLGGLIAVGYGIWTVVDKSFANELLGTNLYAGATWIMILTGFGASAISIVGCMGSIREIRCLLFLYMLCLSFIFVTMLVGGAIAYVFREKAETTVRLGMVRSLRDYGNYNPVTSAWDDTQQRLKCCGIDEYRDWKGYLPMTCCRPSSRGRLQKCTQVEYLNEHVAYIMGCLGVTKRYVQANAFVMGTISTVVSLTTVLGMALSFTLFRIIE